MHTAAQREQTYRCAFTAPRDAYAAAKEVCLFLLAYRQLRRLRQVLISCLYFYLKALLCALFDENTHQTGRNRVQKPGRIIIEHNVSMYTASPLPFAIKCRYEKKRDDFAPEKQGADICNISFTQVYRRFHI